MEIGQVVVESQAEGLGSLAMVSKRTPDSSQHSGTNYEKPIQHLDRSSIKDQISYDIIHARVNLLLNKAEEQEFFDEEGDALRRVRSSRPARCRLPPWQGLVLTERFYSETI